MCHPDAAGALRSDAPAGSEPSCSAPWRSAIKRASGATAQQLDRANLPRIIGNRCTSGLLHTCGCCETPFWRLNGRVGGAEAGAFQQLLRGGGRGEMGLDALAARARDLQKTLDQMATGLAVNAHNIGWCATMVCDAHMVYLSSPEWSLTRAQAVRMQAAAAAVRLAYRHKPRHFWY